MDVPSQTLGIYVRIVALISLALGLSDGARALGVNMGPMSPLETFGATGFAYLALFSLARLFAAVGLWIKASWGAVLLVGSTLVEIALYLSGSPDVRITALGVAVRAVLLLSILVILILSFRHSRAQAME